MLILKYKFDAQLHFRPIVCVGRRPHLEFNFFLLDSPEFVQVPIIIKLLVFYEAVNLRLRELNPCQADVTEVP